MPAAIRIQDTGPIQVRLYPASGARRVQRDFRTRLAARTFILDRAAGPIRQTPAGILEAPGGKFFLYGCLPVDLFPDMQP